jgi:hypothetical protein
MSGGDIIGILIAVVTVTAVLATFLDKPAKALWARIKKQFGD